MRCGTACILFGCSADEGAEHICLAPCFPLVLVTAGITAKPAWLHSTPPGILQDTSFVQPGEHEGRGGGALVGAHAWRACCCCSAMVRRGGLAWWRAPSFHRGAGLGGAARRAVPCRRILCAARIASQRALCGLWYQPIHTGIYYTGPWPSFFPCTVRFVLP